MSWQIQVEQQVSPNRDADKDSILAEILRKAGMDESPMGAVPMQKHGAVLAAEKLLENINTNYPLGCRVVVVCDGHEPKDVLNYEPSHVNVRVMVEPVKIHR